MDTITYIYFFVGAGIVFAFAVNYFNQPSYKFAEEDKSAGADQEDLMLEPALPKYLTCRFEYTLYLFAYILVTELIYVMLVFFLPDLISSESGKTTSALSPTRQNIVLSALIITGMAPNLPYVRQLLERSKFYLHDKAQIPKKGREVYRQIKSYQPHYTRAEIANILKDERYLRGDQDEKMRPDLNESDFKIGAWTLEARWAKLSYLLSYVNRWSKISPFSTYIGNRELQQSSILQAYDHLQKRMARFRNGELPESDTVRLNSRVDATLHRTYRLISCLLYLSGKTDSAVDQFLDQLGYIPSERRDFPIPWKNMTYVIGAIVGSIIVGSLLVFLVAELQIVPLVVKISTKNIIRWTGFALPFISIPVLWVLFIKRYFSSHSEVWPVVTENLRFKKLADRPWHLYLVVAFSAYLIGGLVLFATSIAVKILNGLPIQDLGRVLRSISVWSFVVFITATFAAYRLDSAPNFDRPRTFRIGMRGLGAFLQGLTTTLVIYLAFTHTFAEGELNPLTLPEPDKGKLGVYCLIGFFLGASLYLSFGFGKLRQRRKFWRRSVQRSVIINSGQQPTTGITVNVSKEGALIESDEYLPDENTNIQIADQTGHSAPGRIVKLRGNYLHIHFQDISAWGLVQNCLEIPLPT
jgi:hypothetical protein